MFLIKFHPKFLLMSLHFVFCDWQMKNFFLIWIFFLPRHLKREKKFNLIFIVTLKNSFLLLKKNWPVWSLPLYCHLNLAISRHLSYSNEMLLTPSSSFSSLYIYYFRVAAFSVGKMWIFRRWAKTMKRTFELFFIMILFLLLLFLFLRILFF